MFDIGEGTIGNLIGLGSDSAGAADIGGGGFGGWLGSLLGMGAGAAGDYGVSAATGAGSSLPWGAIVGGGLGLANTGLQAYGLYNQLNPPDMPQYPPMQGMYGQMQSGGVTPQMMRRNLSQAQSQGMSGASPDFLATMAGVSPQELEKMMGYAR